MWSDLGKGYAVSNFTLKLHGWSDTRRFVVVRELERADKSAVGRRLIEVPGYTFRVWVTNRTEGAATLWRDYNGRATIEQRIEELKNDMHADGFCTRKFFATEAAMLSAIFAYNLLAVYQAQVTPQSGWRKPSTLRAAVFICGAVLGRIGRKIVLRLSQTGGGLAKHQALIGRACAPKKPIAPLLVRDRPPAPDWDIVAPGGCMI